MTTSTIPTPLPRRAIRLPKFFGELNLFQQFALITSPILVTGILGIGMYVADQVEEGIVQSVAGTAALYSTSLFEPHVQELRDANTVPLAQSEQLDVHLARQIEGGSIIGVRVWKGETVAYSNDKETIGRSFTPSALRTKAWSGFVSVIYSNGTEIIGQSFPSSSLWRNAWSEASSIDAKTIENDGDIVKQRLGRPVLEIYVPIWETGTDRIIAVAETYQVPPALAELLTAASVWSWIEVGSVALVTILVPAIIVRRGSKTIDWQRRELEDRVKLLSRLLNENKTLHQRANSASQRVSEMNEKYLRRLGADLHDGPVQLIGMSLLRLDSLNHVISTASKEIQQESEEDVTVIRDALRESLDEIRHVSGGLVPPELESLSIEGLIGLVARKHERRTGKPVTLHIGRLPKNPSYSLKVCIYRVAQEGLNNAINHAGGKGQAVTASYDGTNLEITVSDRGPGLINYDDSSWHGRQGLTGLRDRVEALGGRFWIDSRPGEGTRLTARFSIEEEL